MTSFPRTPRVVKAGLVLIDPVSDAVQRIITLQYNPDSLTRTLQARGASDDGDRLEALRLVGPPTETIKLEVELDATDQLEFAAPGELPVEVGLLAQLAALETVLYPNSEDLAQAHELARSGTLEIVPARAPLTVFTWGEDRVLPVRLTEFSVTEQAFDTELNPIRVKVDLGMRVLSVTDLGYGTKGGSLFMVHQKNKEHLARQHVSGSFEELGIGEIT
jgi:hypothetical protein